MNATRMLSLRSSVSPRTAGTSLWEVTTLHFFQVKGKRGKPIALISLGNPYLLRYFPNVSAIWLHSAP